MKRKTKLTVVTALSLCSVFCAGAALSTVRGSAANAEVVSYDGAEAEYILRDYDGYVGVFDAEQDRAPLQITAIETGALRQTDRDMLQGGISVGSREQLLLLLEDLGY